MNVVLRPFNPDSDTGLILDTWTKNAYHSALKPVEEDKTSWFGRMHLHVQVALFRGTTWIACFDEDPNLIAGYAVIHDECLEFIWVKPIYRQMGIGHLLLSRTPILYFNPASLTEQGQTLILELGLKEKPNGQANGSE